MSLLHGHVLSARIVGQTIGRQSAGRKRFAGLQRVAFVFAQQPVEYTASLVLVAGLYRLVVFAARLVPGLGAVSGCGGRGRLGPTATLCLDSVGAPGRGVGGQTLVNCALLLTSRNDPMHWWRKVSTRGCVPGASEAGAPKRRNGAGAGGDADAD